MTRVLLTYGNLRERRIATRRALRLTRRGADVDLASSVAAATLGDHYDHVLDAHALEPALVSAAPAGREGIVGIVGAHQAAPTANRSTRPGWTIVASFVVGALLVAVGAVIGVPILLLVLYALVLAAASTQLFGALHRRLIAPRDHRKNHVAAHAA